ncbi:MAG: hypothetical protein J0G30_10610 [Actinomycetales bacterium]|nr:hypothetical protein [Actinomycetales bacterium]
MRLFVAACDEFAADPAGYRWPRGLRVKPIVGTSDILEMTWSFAGPDGRATFHFESVNEEMYCVWRRVGRHAIFVDP